MTNIIYCPIPVEKSTFKAGLTTKVHRWFRLTPSYGPDLVRSMLGQLEAKSSDVILDPFSGASTTSIECSLNGYDSYGVEINPFLQWVGKVSCKWDLDPVVLQKDLKTIMELYECKSERINFYNLEENGLIIPPIHNPLRWWREDVLSSLLVLKKSIDECSSGDAHKDFFRLGLAGVLIPDLTNVTLGRLQLHFIDRSGEKIEVGETFKSHVNCMISDMLEVSKAGELGKAKIIHGNSIEIDELGVDRPVNCVITSPPYPNRYSYVWNTRPYLYMLDFFSSSKESSELDKSTIGGTWGSATSTLSKGEVIASFDFFDKSINPLVNRIRCKDNLMANYVMKYFNMIAHQVKSISSIKHENLRCAYVVGNSCIKGEYVETDSILGEIFEGFGYKVKSINRMRKRNSGVNLYESIVHSELL